MANISAADVKRLREFTGAGMMDCKKALESHDGDFDKAVEFLRVKGQARAEKRESREAAEGMVAATVADGVGVMIALNCETDFVAKAEPFQSLARQVLDLARSTGAQDASSLLLQEVSPGTTVEALLTEANAAIGEKIVLGKVVRVEGPHVASYLHRKSPDLPPQIGVLVAADAENEVAREVAMHAAAMRPQYLSRQEVPEDVVAGERRIAEDKSREEGKPEAALPKIVEGRVNAFLAGIVLLEQKFAKDQQKTVAQVLQGAGVEVTRFARFEIGV
jgi:elongation factor Ts